MPSSIQKHERRTSHPLLQQQQQPQQQEKQLSKEEMARILENLENEEEKIQEKLMRAKAKGKKRKIEKEW